MGRLTLKKQSMTKLNEEVVCACVDMHTYMRQADEEKDHYYLIGEVIDKLADYEDAEEQGLLAKVIRCKDCKYFSGGGLWDNGHWCGRTARPGDCERVTENDFCSRAEYALAEKGGAE